MLTEISTAQLRQRAVERFWETVPPLWFVVRNNVRTTAAEKFEISLEQFHILRHIRKGICSVSDLADARQISRPAVSQAVEALFEKGLVSRQQDVDDRRFVKLMLTPEGDDLLNKIFQQNRVWMEEKMSSLDDGELKRIIEALETLKDMFVIRS
jgi:DNA-binding MarR family transcriptional regulator